VGSHAGAGLSTPEETYRAQVTLLRRPQEQAAAPRLDSHSSLVTRGPGPPSGEGPGPTLRPTARLAAIDEMFRRPSRMNLREGSPTPDTRVVAFSGADINRIGRIVEQLRRLAPGQLVAVERVIDAYVLPVDFDVLPRSDIASPEFAARFGEILKSTASTPTRPSPRTSSSTRWSRC
jgi:hypothetical protein